MKVLYASTNGEQAAAEQRALDVCAEAAEVFAVDLGGWSAREKKMAGAAILNLVSLHEARKAPA